MEDTVIDKQSSFNPQYKTFKDDASGRVTETVEFYHSKQAFGEQEWFKYEVVYYHNSGNYNESLLSPNAETGQKKEYPKQLKSRSRSSSGSSSSSDSD